MRTVSKHFTGYVAGQYVVNGEGHSGVVRYLDGRAQDLALPAAGVKVRDLYKDLRAGDRRRVGAVVDLTMGPARVSATAAKLELSIELTRLHQMVEAKRQEPAWLRRAASELRRFLNAEGAAQPKPVAGARYVGGPVRDLDLNPKTNPHASGSWD